MTLAERRVVRVRTITAALMDSEVEISSLCWQASLVVSFVVTGARVDRFVYICADPSDRPVARAISAVLDALDIHYWTTSWTGKDSDDLPEDVQTYIDQCTVFVPVVSSRSARASWLERQVARALRHKEKPKPVYPVKVDKCTFTGHLASMQYEWLTEKGRPSDRWFQRIKTICNPTTPLPERILRKHAQGIWALAYDPRLQFFATGGWDGLVKIWTLNERHEGQDHHRLTAQQFDERVLALAYAPDGSELAIGCEDGRIHIWSPTEQRVVKTLTGHWGAVRSLAYTSTGDTLLSASVDSTGLVWERPYRDGQMPTPVRHEKNILSIACGPHDSMFATASEDGTVRLWNNPPTKNHIREFRNHRNTVWGVAFSPDPTSERIASVGRDRTARIWDIETAKEVLALRGHEGSVICVAYSVDGRYLATGSADETVRLWDADTGDHIATLTAHSDAVRAVMFVPDGKTLITASADGTAMVWNLPRKCKVTNSRPSDDEFFVAAAQFPSD